MTTIPLIQYVERFETEEEAIKVSEALGLLLNCVGARAVQSFDYNEPKRPWIAQALFGYEGEVNPEAISSCYGLRTVLCPIQFLKEFNCPKA